MAECPAATDDQSGELNASPVRRLLFPDEELHLKVYLRIRSLTNDEVQRSVAQIPLTLCSDAQMIELLARGETHKFTFSRVFGPETSQEELFEATTQEIINECLKGANGLIFNYGVTNAGKTYTMQGTSMQPGVIPRALDYFFDLLKGRLTPVIRIKPQNGGFVMLQPADSVAEYKIKEDLLKTQRDPSEVSVMDTLSSSRFCSSESIDTSDTHSYVVSEQSTRFSFDSFVTDSLKTSTHSVWVSFMEIYNEQVFDLLIPVRNVRRPLKVCELKTGAMIVRGIREVSVLSALEAYKLFLVGQRNLRCAATKLNPKSSRSHCLFTLKLVSSPSDGSEEVNGVRQLSFCDLAGSERYCKTQNVGDRLHEAGIINTSIMTLGRCIETIRNNQAESKENVQVVPFRESKLTRLFKPYFTGKGKAIMMVNVSPCIDMIDETLHVLRFTAIAKQVVLSRSMSVLLRPCRPTKASIERLRQSLMPGSCSSIEWDFPKSDKGYSPDRSSANTEEEDVDEEEEEEEDDEDDERIAKLVDLVHVLQQRLVEEKQKNYKLERDLRQELCDYFMEKVKETEDYYKERLIEQREDVEELAEKRMEIMTDYVNTVYKRRREESEQSHVEHLAERDTRISELEAEVKFLETKLENVKERLNKTVKAEAEAQEKCTACLFDMQQLKEKFSVLLHKDRSVELENLQNRIDEMEKTNRDLHENLIAKESKMMQLVDALSNIMTVVTSVNLTPRSDVGDGTKRSTYGISSRTIYYSASSESDDPCVASQRSATSFETRHGASLPDPENIQIAVDSKAPQQRDLPPKVPESPKRIHSSIQTDTYESELWALGARYGDLCVEHGRLQTLFTVRETELKSLEEERNVLALENARVLDRLRQLEEQLSNMESSSATADIAIQAEIVVVEKSEDANRDEPSGTVKVSNQAQRSRTLRKKAKDRLSPEFAMDSSSKSASSHSRKMAFLDSEATNADQEPRDTTVPPQKFKVPLTTKGSAMLKCSPSKDEDSRSDSVQRQVLRRLRHRK